VGAKSLAIVIPRHRVVAANRKLGGSSGGLKQKLDLLKLAGHRVAGEAGFLAGLRGREELLLPL